MASREGSLSESNLYAFIHHPCLITLPLFLHFSLSLSLVQCDIIQFNAPPRKKLRFFATIIRHEKVKNQMEGWKIFCCAIFRRWIRRRHEQHTHTHTHKRTTVGIWANKVATYCRHSKSYRDRCIASEPKISFLMWGRFSNYLHSTALNNVACESGLVSRLYDSAGSELRSPSVRRSVVDLTFPYALSN